MSFHVGQKVVCVDDRDNLWTKQWIVRGCVYEVASICESNHDPLGLFEGIECFNITLKGIEKRRGFASVRFRPVIERSTETGMAILRKVADDASKRKNLITTV